MSTTIYALCDPTTLEIRYIGKAINPAKRLCEHVSDTKRGRRTHCARWVRSVGRPIMLRLAVVPDDYGAEMEIRTIAQFQARGYRLTNLTEGGEGHLGWVPPPETRAKIRAALLGRTDSPETRANKRAAHRNPVDTSVLASYGFRGRRHTDSAKAKIASARRKHVTTDAARAANSAGHIGFRHAPETRARMSVLQRGHVCSEATRAKISAAMTGRKRAAVSETARANMKAAQQRRAAEGGFPSGGRRSADARARMSAAATAAWARRKAS